MFILEIGPMRGSGNAAPASGTSKSDAPKPADTTKVTAEKTDEVVIKSESEKLTEELDVLKAKLAKTKDTEQVKDLTRQIKLAEVKLELQKVIENPKDEKQFEAFKQKLFKLPADSSLEDLNNIVMLALNNAKDNVPLLKILDPLEKKFDEAIAIEIFKDPNSANKKLTENKLLKANGMNPNTPRLIIDNTEGWRAILKNNLQLIRDLNDIATGR